MEQLFYVILVESDDLFKYKLLHILLRWVTVVEYGAGSAFTGQLETA